MVFVVPGLPVYLKIKIRVDKNQRFVIFGYFWHLDNTQRCLILSQAGFKLALQLSLCTNHGKSIVRPVMVDDG